jgi:hypothetical protein
MPEGRYASRHLFLGDYVLGFDFLYRYSAIPPTGTNDFL